MFWLMIGLIVVVVGVALAVIFFCQKRALLPAGQDAPPVTYTDQEIVQIASEHGWRCEMQPSPRMRYRLRGEADGGIPWEIIEGMSADGRGTGPRWSSNALSIPQLLIEIYPVALHEHMMDALRRGKWEAGWSAATRHLLQNGKAVPIEIPALAERFVAVTAAPKAADRLLSVDVARAILAIGSDAVRVSVGFPNVRIACEPTAVGPGVFPALVRAGVAIVDRYHATAAHEPLEAA